MAKFCCKMMESQINHYCENHEYQCPDRLIRWSSTDDSEGYYLLVSQNAEYSFQYCPWCGERIPKGMSPKEPGRYLFSPEQPPLV